MSHQSISLTFLDRQITIYSEECRFDLADIQENELEALKNYVRKTAVEYASWLEPVADRFEVLLNWDTNDGASIGNRNQNPDLAS